VTQRRKFFYHLNPEVVSANPTFRISALSCVFKDALLGTDLPSRVATQVYENDMETQRTVGVREYGPVARQNRPVAPPHSTAEPLHSTVTAMHSLVAPPHSTAEPLHRTTQQ